METPKPKPAPLPDPEPLPPRQQTADDYPQAHRINLEAVKRVVVEGKSGVLVVRDGRELYRITIQARDLTILAQRLSLAAWKIGKS